MGSSTSPTPRNDRQVPLVVDVDGTLIRSDLLWEGLVRIVLTQPHRLVVAAVALLRGRAGLKEYVARVAGVDVHLLPLEPSVMRLISDARTEGNRVVLASAAHYTHVAALAERVGADEAYGSDARVNLKGSAKLDAIRARYSTFDYVGNSSADHVLWSAARKAYAVNASPTTRRRGRGHGKELAMIGSGVSRGQALIRAIRPHQWSKNALLVLPALAAHLPWSGSLAWTVATGFFAFSFLASAGYILNDLADLPHDRQHKTKRHRPVTSGDLPIPWALASAVGLVGVAGAIAWTLPAAFRAVLASYFVISVTYSLVLKRHEMIDVITLATLYTARVVAGAVLVDVALSRWFLAFSVFFFLSLALIKRVAELLDPSDEESDAAPGRGYLRSDVPFLTSFGSAAVAASGLVYCLYITGDDLNSLYSSPDLLWFGLPLLLYWQGRIWMLAARGKMMQNPVLFALRDTVSHVTIGAFLVAVWLAI